MLSLYDSCKCFPALVKEEGRVDFNCFVEVALSLADVGDCVVGFVQSAEFNDFIERVEVDFEFVNDSRWLHLAEQRYVESKGSIGNAGVFLLFRLTLRSVFEEILKVVQEQGWLFH